MSMQNWFEDVKVELAQRDVHQISQPASTEPRKRPIRRRYGLDDLSHNEEVALVWAGIRPWVMAALRNEKILRYDLDGDEAARRVRRRLADAIEKLPLLPEYDLPLGYAVGDEAHLEIRINRDHPAYVAALDHADEFASLEKQELVRDAINYVTVLPARGYKLRNPYTKSGSRRSGLAPSTRSDVLHRDDYRCHYCGRRAPNVELHVDHRIPVSQGGTDDMSNLITACADCNRGKSDRFAT